LRAETILDVLVCNPEVFQVFSQRKKGGRRRRSIERQFVNEVRGINLRRKIFPGAGIAQGQLQRPPAFVAARLSGLKSILHRASSAKRSFCTAIEKVKVRRKLQSL
jgi:hypothetical protein